MTLTSSPTATNAVPASEPIDEETVPRLRLLFLTAIIGVAVYVVLDAVAQSLPPHYSPLSQAESDLAVGPYGYIMTINFIIRGILSLCLLVGLELALKRPGMKSRRFVRGSYLFAAWSVGALLLAAFPTDVPPTPISWHEAIHIATAFIAFIGGGFGALYISLGLPEVGPLASVRRAAVPLSYLAVGLCLFELLVGFHSGIFTAYGGLIERMFLGSVLLWVLVVSLKALAQLPRPQPA